MLLFMGPDQPFEPNTIGGHVRTFKYEAAIGHTDHHSTPATQFGGCVGCIPNYQQPIFLWNIYEFAVRGCSR